MFILILNLIKIKKLFKNNIYNKIRQGCERSGLGSNFCCIFKQARFRFFKFFISYAAIFADFFRIFATFLDRTGPISPLVLNFLSD